MFDFQKFNILILNNIWIIGSKIKNFIRAFPMEFDDSILTISHIYTSTSNLTDFFLIERVRKIMINTFVNENSTFNGFIFMFTGLCD